MAKLNNSGRRRAKNQYVTKSGNVFHLNRSLTERWVARKDAAERRKAERMAGLPKSRFKRLLYHLEPKRLYHYWFSRDGAIMALKVVGIGLVVSFVLLLGIFAYFRKDLPNLNGVTGNNLGGSIRYYDRTGKTLLWEDYDAVKRIPVKTDEINKYVRDATVAVEDKDFFKHGGFDVRGILRAGINDTFHQGSTQGGSTITQQLVKLSEDWNGQRTITRKIKEVILAVELERSYSKQDILTGYLNAAPYGNIEYGVEAASRDYFQKSAKDLTLSEATFLAAIPKSPSYYSPYGSLYKQDPSAAQKDLISRQHYILDLMVNQGYISQKQASDAKKVDVVAEIHPQQTKFAGIKAPWFVLAAKTQLEQEYGTQTVNRGGWKVITSLDMNLQTKAEQLVASNLPNVSRYGADEEAIVGEDVQSGQIVSLVGGTDFNNPDHGQNNFGAGILLPPGSSFKPYDYSTLIENHTNVGAGSVFYDTVGPLPGYPCTNKATKGGNCLQDYDFLQPGPLTLRYSLGGSRNIPAVKAMLSSVPNDTSNGHVDSVNKVISTASAMMYNPRISGNTYNCYADEALTKTTQCYGASAIGDGAFLHLDDHVNGLATLARMGKAITRTYIISITDSANKNVPLIKYPAKQPIRPDTAYIMDDMASDPKASYLPGSCTDTNCTSLGHGGYKFHRYNGWHFAIKTGTTNDGYDGLMTSWSPKYAVVSWVGNHTRHVTLRTSMEYLTEPLTRGWMEAAHANLPAVNWVQPSDIKSQPAFVVRNHVHYGDIEPSPTNDLFPSWYTGNSNQANANKPIDIVSNKLATSCTPSLAVKTGGNSNSNTWSVDIFVNGGASGATANTNAQDDIHQCSDQRPVIDSFSVNGQDMTSGGSANCTGSCTVATSYHAGTHPLTDPQYAGVSGSGTVQLLVDGQTVQSQPASGSNSFSYNGSGSHSVSIKIVDSVLYDTTSSQASVNFTAAGPQSFSATKSTIPNKTTFSWSGGNGSFTVYKSDGSTVGAGCTNISSNTCSINNLPSGTFYVQDSDGNKSNSSST